MSTLLTPEAKHAALDAAALNGLEAAKFTGLSAKTLDRLAEAGEPIGRLKIGRRVVYLKAALAAWLASKSNTTTHTTH